MVKALRRVSFVVLLLAAIPVPRVDGESWSASALFQAVRDGDRAGFVRMLDAGADVDSRTEAGATLLMSALENGKADIAGILLERGVDLEARDLSGHTALMYAAQYGRVDLLRELLRRGADIDAADRTGATAVIFASLFGQPEVAHTLVEEKADLGACTEQGWSALMCASQSGYKQIVELLIEGGADVRIAARTGITAIQLAAQRRHPEIVVLLRGAGAEDGPSPAPEAIRKISSDIRYVPCTDAEKARVRELVYDLLLREDSGAAFPKVVLCGPFLWEELRSIMGFDQAAGIPVDFVYPSSSGNVTFQGRAVRWEEKTRELQLLLRAIFRGNGGFTVRELTSNEISFYWSYNSWDIEEPVFVLESPGFRMIVDFIENDVFFLDNYYRLTRMRP